MLGRILKEKDLSYAWLSRRLGVNRSTVQKWVVDNKKPKEKYYLAIAQALGITEDEVKEMFEK